jgi:hypothetical protein
MFTNNHYLKYLCLGFFCFLIIMLIKISYLEKQIEIMNKNMSHMISYEDYMISFNNMFDAKLNGENFLDT